MSTETQLLEQIQLGNPVVFGWLTGVEGQDQIQHRNHVAFGSLAGVDVADEDNGARFLRHVTVLT